MDLDNYKQYLIEKLMAEEDEQVLRDVDRALEYGKATAPDELSPEQIGYLKKSIEQAKNGKVVSKEEVGQEVTRILSGG